MSSSTAGPILPLPARGAGVLATAAALREQPAVDGLRVFAAFAVICLHTGPFNPESMEEPTALSDALGWCINVLALFAVPYFFVVSGFFFGRNCRRQGIWKAARRFGQRIAVLYAVWCLLYALTPGPAMLHRLGFAGALARNLERLGQHVLERPVHFLCNGTGMQLWFLSALCLAAVLCALLLWAGNEKYLLPVAGGVFALGLMGQGYGQALGISLPFDCNTRLGPFFGFPLFALGVWQSGRRQPIYRGARRLVLAGGVLLFAEAAVLSLGFGTHVSHYYLASALLGLGLLRLALARPRLLGGYLPRLGALTPGVYLLHLGFVSLAEQLHWGVVGSVGWQVAVPVSVFFLSTLCTAGLQSVPGVRRLV